MKRRIPLKLLILAGVVAVLAAGNGLLLLNPDMHVYPAVTRCRLCGDRVWAWQSYERRDYKVKADNPDHLPMVVDMSGLVHCDCRGTPEATVKITSKGVSTPVLGAKEAMGITVPQ